MIRNVVVHLKTVSLFCLFAPAVLGTPAARAETSSESAGQQEPGGSIEFGEALSLALRGNPELAAFAWEIRARDAQILQASLLPNPELGIEIEEFGGSGESAAFDGSETTFQLNQKIELGGKRAKRSQVVFLQRDLACWDYDAKKLDVIAETTRAFVDVLAAQERMALTEELVELAQNVLDAAAQRVKAGKVSPLEETKGKVALSMSRIEFERAVHELDASRRRLVTLWGARRPRFERAVGALDTITPVPPIEEFVGQMSANPDVARWDAEMERRRAALAFEKAGRVPDLTLSGGVRYLGETDDYAFVMEAGLPLPLFDRNQGMILEAQHRLSQVKQQQRAAEARVLRELAEAYRKLSAAFAETAGLKADVLPGARRAFDAYQEGYRQGKFGYLEVLDAQRTLFEARGRYIEALALYRKAFADIERAVGGGIERVKGRTDGE